MTDKTMTKCRTMFSASEEEVIKKFLLSCWSKKLKIPQVLFYDALKKHADRFPRKSRAKDNRPSHFWRSAFFQRHPSVQAAFDTYKNQSPREMEVVSDHILNKFLSDLACVDKPPPPNEDHDPEDVRTSSSPVKAKRRNSLPEKRLPKTATTSSAQYSADNKQTTKHQRSKTFDISAGSLTKKTSWVPMKGGSNDRLPYKKRGRPPLNTFKLSAALFKPTTPFRKKLLVGQQPTSQVSPLPNEPDSPPASPKKLKDREMFKKKVDPTSSRSKDETAAETIPLEPIKFEVGANIEAMDGSKWYKAKIIELYLDRQEILVHFNGWRKRFDTIFPMTSGLIRGPTLLDKKTELVKFNVGDDVLSQWTDGSFYPATVMSIRDSGSYVVMFYDGLKKLVRPNLLKPMTEKEKEAAMKAAQAAYLSSVDVAQASSSQGIVSSTGQNFRRYRTSAHDREQRITARQTDGGGIPTRSRGRKRKFNQIESPQTGAGPQLQIPSTPPAEGGKFQAKQARLDKITHTLLDKAVPTCETIPTGAEAAVFSPAMKLSSSPMVVDTGGQNTQATEGEDMIRSSADEQAYSSDEFDTPLVIDEDGDGKAEGRQAKSLAMKPSPVVAMSPPISSVDTEACSSSGEELANNNNLHQLADAALSHSSSFSSPETQQESGNETGAKRQEASEALLQLAHFTSESEHKIESAKTVDKVEGIQDLNNMPLKQRMAMGADKVLKENATVAKVAADLDLTVKDLSDALSGRSGVIYALTNPFFLDTYEEDIIVNWIHDITDLGWGISNSHITSKIKHFLTEGSTSVVFDETSPLNLPPEKWLNDFLDRHPEVFPGREQPLSRFRFDRDGFEDWLGRWLAVIRLNNVPSNAVYYCDETVWDANPKLMHGVKFVHQSISLTDGPPGGNKITTLSCVGADGLAFSPFHIFPDNEGDSKIPGGKLIENIVFSHHGVLSSRYFLQWMKKNFLRGIPARKKSKPIALLVDISLEKLDFEVLKFAYKNKILLYRFLPSGAHFIQHPDQKLFGRLRLQWKKALFSDFMKNNAGKKVSTQTFASYFKQEFQKIATPSTIKMCFELTKLYTPVPEPVQVSPIAEKKNKRKSTRPVPCVASPSTSRSSPNQSKGVSAPGATTMKTDTNKPLPPAASTPANPPTAKPRRGRPPSRKFATRKSLPSDLTTKQGGNGSGEGSDVTSARGKSVEDFPVPVLKSNYKKGELVLAKWTDCRLYSATILKKIDENNYRIRYFDGFVKAVSTDFLRAWSGLEASNHPPKLPHTASTAPPQSKSDSVGRSRSISRKSDDSLPKPGSTRTTQPRSLSLGTQQKAASRGGIQADRRRHSTNLDLKTKTRRGSGTTSEGITRSSRRSTGGADVAFGLPGPKKRIYYKPGDSVLCKWTDRKMYPATVVGQFKPDSYLVKYFDNRKKNVHHTWLLPWKPPTSPPEKPAAQTPHLSLPEKVKTEISSPAVPEKVSTPPTIAAKAEGNAETDSPVLQSTFPAESHSPEPMSTPAESTSTPTNASESASVVQLIKTEPSSAHEDIASDFQPRTDDSASKETKNENETPSTKLPESSAMSRRSSTDSQKKTPRKTSLSETEVDFKKGESVLARWADCKSYPATVLRIDDEGLCVVQYFDGMVRKLKKEMLKKWDPNAVPRPRRVYGRKKKVASLGSSQPKPDTGDQQHAKTDQEKIKAGSPEAAATKPTRSKSNKPVLKPGKVVYTYEAYYAKLTQESELNKFKCRVPGCNKVFRRELVLRQHHKHYHLQRYKLRDQETVPAQKRKASKDDPVPAKRRVSADYHLTKALSAKPLAQGNLSLTHGKPTRSRGGKPPLDVYRMQQGGDDVVLTSPSSESTSSVAMTSLHTSDDAKPHSSLEEPTSSGKKRAPTITLNDVNTPTDVKETEPVAKPASSSDAANTKSPEVVNEDIIRCLCGEEEEEGFMLQCDSCLTWQHAKCEGISPPEPSLKQTEENPPEYICKICREPPGVRESQKYQYNNDFLTKGSLPVLASSSDSKPEDVDKEEKFQTLMLATHQLMEELTKMQESLHGLRLKIDVANPATDHPLLQLWKETNLMDVFAPNNKSADLVIASSPSGDSESDQQKQKDPTSSPKTDAISTAEQKPNEVDEGASDEARMLHRTIRDLILEMVESVSSSSLPGDASPQLFVGASKETSSHDDVTDDVTGVGISERKTKESDAVEKMEVDEKSTTLDSPTETANEKSIRIEPAESQVEATDEKTENSTKETESDQNSKKENDLWTPIKIRREVIDSSSSQDRKSEGDQEEMVIRCRRNLLQHIHYLENCLSERLVQLEDYVCTIETSFNERSRSSPPSSGHHQPAYDGRLGELKSDLGLLHDDINAVQQLLSSPPSTL